MLKQGQKPRQSLGQWLGKVTVLLMFGLFCLVLGGFSIPVMAADVGGATTVDAAVEARLQKAEQLFADALTATQKADFAAAESIWGKIIELVPENPAAWSNRGNARVSQGKLAEAITDYDKAIAIAPEQPDAYLNRGAALEGLGQWQAAIDDYNRVLVLDSKDPAAFNNRGNAQAGQGNWQAALEDYYHAFELAPDYAFARANYALALYELGKPQQSIKAMQDLVRRYPNFADMRASLTAALWGQGRKGEAESYWAGVLGLDTRYKDLDWVTKIRRWPPSMVADLEKFLQLRS